MAFRLALVACSAALEGPWTLAKGNEVGLEVIHLMEGERVRLDMESDTEPLVQYHYDQPGSFPVFFAGRRYRVSKEVTGDNNSPTIVKILLRS